jgi:hypothetical protein
MIEAKCFCLFVYYIYSKSITGIEEDVIDGCAFFNFIGDVGYELE